MSEIQDLSEANFTGIFFYHEAFDLNRVLHELQPIWSSIDRLEMVCHIFLSAIIQCLMISANPERNSRAGRVLRKSVAM